MIFLGILTGLVIGLILLYLLRPYYKPYQLSAAQFFEQTPPEQEKSLHFNLATVVFSRSFWVQLAVFGTLIVALLLAGWKIDRGQKANTIGVLVAVDSSASMSTRHQNGTRMDAARDEATELSRQLVNLQQANQDVRFCASLVTFDDGGQRDILTNVSPEQLTIGLANLESRPLGTNLNAIHSLLQNTNDETTAEPDDCPFTHVVVISDVPAPAWVEKVETTIQIIWRDTGDPVNNTGFVRITPVGAAQLGWAGDITIEVATYGTPPAETNITVKDDTGAIIGEPQTLTWRIAGTQSINYSLGAPGLYTVTITPGGDYTHDDQVTIAVPDFQQVHYDWQLPVAPPPYFDLLGWIPDASTPDLRIIPPGDFTSDVATLVIDNSYRRAAEISEMGYFEDDTGLLDDLNLDAAEELRIAPFAPLTGIPHTVILADKVNNVLVLANEDVPFVYIPGPPLLSGDEMLDAFSQTLFFNAVRWLLNANEATIELYRLTNASQPIPQDDIATLTDSTDHNSIPVVVLHENEGNTATANTSSGEFTDITPQMATAPDNPGWMVLVMLASVLLTLERTLALYGGSRWS